MRENILTENGRHLWKHTAAELRDYISSESEEIRNANCNKGRILK